MEDDDRAMGEKMKQEKSYFLKDWQGRVITEEVTFDQRPKRGESQVCDDLGSSDPGRGNSPGERA